MNRQHLQSLASTRVQDAEALLAAQRWSGAYYLSGYAIECALKSCVLAYVERTGVLFIDRTFAKDLWTHDLEALASRAGLDASKGQAMQSNPRFGVNWNLAKDWSESDRYAFWTRTQAEALFEAVTHSTDGVLRWIENHW